MAEKNHFENNVADDLSTFIVKAREQLLDSIEVKKALAAGEQLEIVARVAALMIDAYQAGGKVILLGNGGSAADAQHLACEFISRFERERAALPALALSVNTSILTAVGNDYDFQMVFARQVAALASSEDVVVGISTSGNSKNVIEAMKTAREIGAKTVAFTGRTGGELIETVDVCLCVPSESTPRIQEGHIAAGHIICSIVENALFEGEDDA